MQHRRRIAAWALAISLTLSQFGTLQAVQPGAQDEQAQMRPAHNPAFGMPCAKWNTHHIGRHSFAETFERATAIVEQAVGPVPSWAIGWDDLADDTSEVRTSSSWSTWWSSRAPQHPSVDAARNTIADSNTAGPLLKEMVSCWNSQYKTTIGATWDDVTTGMHLPNLKIVAGWWASEVQPVMQVTLTTFADIERLQQIWAQCVSWFGPLSVAVYQPLYQPQPGKLTPENKAILRRAVLRVMQFVLDMQHQPSSCQLSLLLVYEVITDMAAVPLYPLNALRNVARLQVRTPLSLMLDVDLLPSRSLYARLSNPQRVSQLIAQAVNRKEVFIIPAFELSPLYDTVLWADALASAPNKDLISQCMDINAVFQFHMHGFNRGHRMTDYWQWRHLAHSDYQVSYEQEAEPWVMGSRFLMPFSDDRYRGYGWDKIQFINHLYHAGFRFMVVHDAYAIHRPHPVASARSIFLRNRAESKPGTMPLKEFVWGLYQEQLFHLQSGITWQPATADAVMHCRSQLSWWSPVAAAAQTQQA